MSRYPILALSLLVATSCAAAPTGIPAAAEANADSFQTARIPMRDGTLLEGDIFLPEREGPFPVIMEFTPYGRGPEALNFRYEAPYWTARGFAFAMVDSRGTGGSEGNFGFFQADVDDGYDLVEWMARQPWSDGKVAMRGSSYTGTNQWHTARSNPPALKCLAPSATVGRPMVDLPYRGGALGLGWTLDWYATNVLKLPKDSWPNPDPNDWLGHRPLATLDVFAAGRALAFTRQVLAHPTLDDYWQGAMLSDEGFAGIDIPTLAFSGWFDGTLSGTIWNYHKAATLSQAPGDQFLIIGPYTHMNAVDGGIDFITGHPTTRVGEFDIAGNAALPGLEMTTDFFEWCLKDGPRPDFPNAQFYITGSDVWLSPAAYPLTEAQPTSLYLSSDGSARGAGGAGALTFSPKGGQAGADTYIYDPADPVMDTLADGTSLSLPVDIASLHQREDVLVYTSDVLEQPLTVLGNVSVDLYVSSSAVDTDFVVQIMDVRPDGKAVKLGPQPAGQIRTRYREGYERETLMNPGEVYRLSIDMKEIGHTFLPGHQIRIAVMSSLYPWISANPNTGNPIATDIAEPVIATQSVLHGDTYPSRLILPVIALGDDPA